MRRSTSVPERLASRRLARSACTALLAVALAACAPRDDGASLTIANARVEARGTGAALALECDWRPSAAMLEALDHGIVLALRLRLDRERHGLAGWRVAQSTERHLELRYFPLTRQYQLRDLEQGSVRSFGVRAAALAAFSRLELPLPDAGVIAGADERQRLRIEFDSSRLPGALRLPVLVQRQWWQPTVERTWPSSRAG